MKKPIRYSCGSGEGMFDNKNGHWVEYSEYLKLLKENEQLRIGVVGSSLCIDDELADVLVEKIYKENKEDLQYLTDKEGLFKAGLAHGLLSKIRLHE